MKLSLLYQSCSSKKSFITGTTFNVTTFNEVMCCATNKYVLPFKQIMGHWCHAVL